MKSSSKSTRTGAAPKARVALRILPFVLGIVLLGFGLISISAYYGQAKPQTIGGNEVMAAFECSGGYAVGSCPIVSDDWTGTLVNPSPGLSGGIPDIWRLQGSSADTCGLPATYLLNLPATTSNGSQSEVGGVEEPPYLPLGHGVEGVITYGSLVYAYTSDRYSAADGCHGTDLASSVGTPVQGTVTYTSAGARTLVLGTGGTYSFSEVDIYMAALIVGAFIAIYGFYWAFGFLLMGEFLDEGDNPLLHIRGTSKRIRRSSEKDWGGDE